MRTRSALLLALALLVAGVAHADVIHLKTGRSISGTIVSETETEVVVKTPDGRMTLRRDMIERITRQSRGETLLALARERAAAGAHDDAERLFLQAAESDDPAVVRRAQAELATFRERRERAKNHRPPPTTPLPLPPETEGEPVEGLTLQDDLDRARRALETGEHARARRLLENLVAGNPNDKALRYLLGRALELGRVPAAREAYQAALGELFTRDPRPVAWLGELARRSLSGEALDAESAGVGPAWRRVETERFAVYHPFERVETWFAEEPEAALRDVREKLGVQDRDVQLAGRIQIFVYATADDYQARDGMKLAGGHAQQLTAPDGALKLIRAYPDRTLYRRTFRHEVAHVLLFDLHPGLPSWANEGAATYTEPLRSRVLLRQAVVGRKANGQLPDLLTFMRGEVPRGENVEDVRAYYGQASVLFEALVQRCGDSPRKALSACMRIARDGPERGLLMENISRRELEQTFDRIAADRTIPPDEE
jgi:hypothetical protein